MSAPNARRLASIWKALLQDYLTLFVAGQRPSQLAELSSRAKDLLAIFDESARLGAKGGIPIRVVYPPPSILARAVREMALYMPGESPQSTWTVLEGRWIGTIDLSGDARQVRIEFRTGNKELAGAMITQQGQLTMEASLREIVFDKGSLRFAVLVGQTQHYLKGTLNNDTLSGTVHPGSASAPAKGGFTLRVAN
jgi:hypothetical protein